MKFQLLLESGAVNQVFIVKNELRKLTGTVIYSYWKVRGFQVGGTGQTAERLDLFADDRFVLLETGLGCRAENARECLGGDGFGPIATHTVKISCIPTARFSLHLPPIFLCEPSKRKTF